MRFENRSRFGCICVLMPRVLIINGLHVGIFTCDESAKKWMDENRPNCIFLLVDIDKFYETDFIHERRKSLK
jgi:hypothetical protein